MPGEAVQGSRRGEREGRPAQQEPQERREADQQHDVERQHVHVHRLELQQERLDERHVRVIQEVEDAHLLAVERVLEGGRQIGDLGEVDDEQEHVGDVDLPGPPQDAGARDHQAALAHRPPIDECRGVARNEDEDLGGVAEAIVADRHPAHDVRRNMVEEDQPERDTPEQVEPEVALGRSSGWRHWRAGFSRIGKEVAGCVWNLEFDPPSSKHTPLIPAQARIQTEPGPRFRGDERSSWLIQAHWIRL